MSNSSRLVIAALVVGWITPVSGLRAEVIVTQGENISVPLVIHGAPIAPPPAVIFIPQPPTVSQPPIVGPPNYGTVRASQSNVERLLGRTERLRGASHASGSRTIILLK